MPGKRNKRRVFLEHLGKALVTPFIARRERIPRTEASTEVVRAVKAATAAAQRALDPGDARPEHLAFSLTPCAAGVTNTSASAHLSIALRVRPNMGWAM